MSAVATMPQGARQADARRAARAARVVQERRQRRMAVRAEGRRRPRRIPARARSRRAGDGARPRLEPDRPRRRRARRRRPPRQAVREDRAGSTQITLRCGGGASGILVSSTARDAGIAGLEFLRGIPGTVGGFVRMNGGAYGREVSGHPRVGAGRAALRRGRSNGRSTSSATPIATATCPTARWSSRRPSAARPATPQAIGAEMDADRRRARGIAAAAQPHRRLDLQEPAGPQGVGAGRRGRLPRAHAWAARKSRKSIAISCSISVARRAPTSRRWARKSAAGCEAKTNIMLEWEIQRVGQRMNRRSSRRRPDGRLVGRARSVADQRRGRRRRAARARLVERHRARHGPRRRPRASPS